MPAERSRVLIIDDSDDKSFEVALNATDITATTLLPNDVEKDDLLDADLVLIDYQLDDWPERQAVNFSLRPPDGLALSALLRRQIHDDTKMSPTAFAIRTGQMENLASPLPPESRTHVLARINNLEWVFDKSADRETAVRQVRSLTEAVRSLPQDWPATDSNAQAKMCDLLKLDDGRSPDLLVDVLDCLPPLHSMSQWSHGLAFVRWFLHRILPYPCFLLDEHHLAARLRVSLASLRRFQDGGRSLLNDSRYSGLLSDFLGPRWWRGDVERLIWEGTDGDTLDGERLRKWLAEELGAKLEPAATDQFPVVCLDEKHSPLDDVYSMEKCVRLQPDDWPGFADSAWTTIDLAEKHPALASLIKASDRGGAK